MPTILGTPIHCQPHTHTSLLTSRQANKVAFSVVKSFFTFQERQVPSSRNWRLVDTVRWAQPAQCTKIARHVAALRAPSLQSYFLGLYSSSEFFLLFTMSAHVYAQFQMEGVIVSKSSSCCSQCLRARVCTVSQCPRTLAVHNVCAHLLFTMSAHTCCSQCLRTRMHSFRWKVWLLFTMSARTRMHSFRWKVWLLFTMSAHAYAQFQMEGVIAVHNVCARVRTVSDGRCDCQ